MSRFRRIPGLVLLTLLLPACAAEQAKETKSLDQIHCRLDREPADDISF